MLNLGRCVVLGVASAAACLSQAVVLIDDFSTGAYSLEVSPSSTVAEAVRAGSMLGGERDALLRHISGPVGISSVVLPGGLVVFYSSGSQTAGVLSLQYDGQDGESESDGVFTNGTGLNLDLSPLSHFQLQFAFLDTGISPTLSVQVHVVSASGTLSGGFFVPEGAPTALLPFASLTGSGTLTGVQRIQFDFAASAAADFTLSSISAVPVPPLLVPFGLATLALMARGRRSRRQAE